MERIALFAGSFDPFTVAHFSLAKRASALFDRVIIAVGENVQKHPLFSTELRVKLIQKATANLENVCVKSYAGLTGNFATENGAKFLLRGIRSPNEFDIERNLAWNNARLYPEIETVYLQVEAENAAVSSSAVREILKFGGDISSMVPPSILGDILNATEKF